MPPSQGSVAPPDYAKTAGPLLLSYMLNWGLYGVLSLQIYLYYLAFPKDRSGTKTIVYGTYLLETTQTILFSASAFQVFATNFGSAHVLDEVHTFWFAAPMLTGIVAFTAQSFYAYRITVLSERKHVASAVMLLALVQLCGSFYIGIQVKHAGLFSHLLKKHALIAVGIWQGGSAACDLLIAAAMTYYLRHRDSGMPETHALITNIIRLTIETGSLTATISVISLILSYLPGQPSYYRTTVSVLAKLYSNSMMVVLNSRMRVSSGTSILMQHNVIIPLTHSSQGSESKTGLGSSGSSEEMTFTNMVHPGKIDGVKVPVSAALSGKPLRS